MACASLDSVAVIESFLSGGKGFLLSTSQPVLELREQPERRPKPKPHRSRIRSSAVTAILQSPSPTSSQSASTPPGASDSDR